MMRWFTLIGCEFGLVKDKTHKLWRQGCDESSKPTKRLYTNTTSKITDEDVDNLLIL